MPRKVNSLFGSESDDAVSDAASDSDSEPDSAPAHPGHPDACTPIPGLYLFRNALPSALYGQLANQLSRQAWTGASDQIMLFERPGHSALPPFLDPLLAFLPTLFAGLPAAVQHTLADPTRPRQAILNLYRPGQGITPHVDLPTRYADGIVGISLLSSVVMDFVPVHPGATQAKLPSPAPAPWSMRLRPGDVYVLSGPARWDWTHGIAPRLEDIVQDEQGQPMLLRRGTRMSITLRRMLDGADVVGPLSVSDGNHEDGLHRRGAG